MRLRIRLVLMSVGLFLFQTHLFAATNAGAGIPVALSPEERDWISQHPVLRVGVVTNWAPFSYVGPDERIVGIDIDLLDLISRRTGLKFQLVPQRSWDELVSNLDQVDMVSSVAQSPLRDQVAEFTIEYSPSPTVIVEREEAQVFGTGAVLRDKKIAMPRRHILTQALTNRFPSVRIRLANTQDECFRLVANKEADATLVNLFVASQYLNSHPDLRLTIAGVLVKPQYPLRMAVHRGAALHPAVGILNKGLVSISQQELDDIYAKHLLFGLESRARFSLMRRRAIKALAVVGGAAGIMFLWNLFMRREIRARRKVEAELREANESMEVFSHSLSHDLRSPVRGMTGLAQALKEDQYEKLDAEGKDYLDHIIATGLRTEKLIADVLTYSRTTSADWPMSNVELDPLVHQLIEGFPPEQRECFQVASKLPSVRGHATLLNQCLGNLLSNAVNYVPENQTPRIEISARRDDSKISIFVQDNGIGVKPEDKKRIFKIFERAAPATYKGTGIGLAVVAKAAERMGGKVGVESEFGKGSRFWIQLPVAKAEKPVRQASPKGTFWHRFALLKRA